MSLHYALWFISPGGLFYELVSRVPILFYTQCGLVAMAAAKQLISSYYPWPIPRAEH